MAQLMLPEMTEPRLPARTLVRELVDPIRRAMVDAMKRSDPALSDDDALLCLHSVVAQLVHLFQVQRVLRQSEDRPVIGELERVLEHIVVFSTAGIRAASRATDGRHRKAGGS